jgi:hypothetical protein
MGRIEGATSPHAKAGKLPRGMRMTRRLEETTKGGKADDGRTLYDRNP